MKHFMSMNIISVLIIGTYPIKKNRVYRFNTSRRVFKEVMCVVLT